MSSFALLETCDKYVDSRWAAGKSELTQHSERMRKDERLLLSEKSFVDNFSLSSRLPRNLSILDEQLGTGKSFENLSSLRLTKHLSILDEAALLGFVSLYFPSDVASRKYVVTRPSKSVHIFYKLASALLQKRSMSKKFCHFLFCLETCETFVEFRWAVQLLKIYRTISLPWDCRKNVSILDEAALLWKICRKISSLRQVKNFSILYEAALLWKISQKTLIETNYGFGRWVEALPFLWTYSWKICTVKLWQLVRKVLSNPSHTLDEVGDKSVETILEKDSQWLCSDTRFPDKFGQIFILLPEKDLDFWNVLCLS